MEDGDGDGELATHDGITLINELCGSSDEVTEVLKLTSDLSTPERNNDSVPNCLVDMEQNTTSSTTTDIPIVKVNGEVSIAKCNDFEYLQKLDNDQAETAATEGASLSPTCATKLKKSLLPRKRKRTNSPLNNIVEDLPSNDDNGDSFKGFKKRMLTLATNVDAEPTLANTEKAKPSVSIIDNSSLIDEDNCLTRTETDTKSINVVTKSKKKLSQDASSTTPQAEYAQYLGLQPTVKFKCYKCEETGFLSMNMLQEHQNTCLTNSKLQSVPKPLMPHLPTDTSPSTNFRITRKVYLCSSCGTYYENWNLFLHMRQVHRRHICLLCLSMFAQADKLANHLTSKHGILETVYAPPEQWFNECNGCCFLMCTTCESVFTEQDNFLTHACKEILRVNSDKPCTSCNLLGSHLPTCYLAITDGSPSLSSPKISTPHSSILETTIEPNCIPQLPIPKPNDIDAKYSLPSPNVGSINNPVKNATGGNRTGNANMLYAEDDYDICNAASFCHVNILEPSEKQKAMQNSRPKTVQTTALTLPDLAKDISLNETIEKSVILNDSSDLKRANILENLAIDERTTNGENEKIELISPTDSNDHDDIQKDFGIVPSTNISDPKEIVGADTNCGNLTQHADLALDIFPILPNSDCITSPKMDLNNLESFMKHQTENLDLPSCPKLHIPHSPKRNVDLSDMSSQNVKIALSELGSEIDSNSTQPPFISDFTKSAQENLDESAKSVDRLEESSIDQQDADDHKLQAKEVPNIHTQLKSDDNNVPNVNAMELNLNQSCSIRKSTRKRTSTFKMKSSTLSGAKPDIKPNPTIEIRKEVEVRSKTPLTVTFFKTLSSSANANYTTSLGGIRAQSDVNDSDPRETSEAINQQWKDETSSQEQIDAAISDSAHDEEPEKTFEEIDPYENVAIAGEEIPIIELHLEETLETTTIESLLQESVKTTCSNCIFCNHAKKIAVNGMQLALHLLAEHRFMPVYKNESTSIVSNLSIDDVKEKIKSVCEEETFKEGSANKSEETEKLVIRNNDLLTEFVTKLKVALPNLYDLFLNTDTYNSSDRTFTRPYDRTYECFQCNFITTLHKDLFSHNRKMHQRTILLCNMCRSNFYSYSELLCHLCPGIYTPGYEIKFHCCICSVDRLPSAFRLMVHLRKRHHTCDVCLDITNDQQKLSTHVWKHKLQHLCYRCGIAYRNKPDITKHLFWKHGTESVLCKKCLQKKWPHVYHFCLPPNAFICEECNASFTRAVALKVHKRLHAGDLPYCCTEPECEEHFVSKKLLARHQDKHKEVPLTEKTNPDIEENTANFNPVTLTNDIQPSHEPEMESMQNADVESPHIEELPELKTEAPEKPIKDSKKHSSKKQKTKVVDVYDLPPLNLSSDSDDSDDEKSVKTQDLLNSEPQANNLFPKIDSVQLEEESVLPVEEDSCLDVQTVDGVWDNFQNYKANLERRESQNNETLIGNGIQNITPPTFEAMAVIMGDHDYCIKHEVKEDENVGSADSLAKTLNHVQEQQNIASFGEHKSDISMMNNSFDHDYCTISTRTTTEIDVPKDEVKEQVENHVSQVEVPSDDVVNKKKLKVVKKKKHNMSSSSSDSSSDSGSSSCSCGTNCSCSSSSSSSSGSTSESSKSDSSSSEGRRQQMARRLKRRERRKVKKIETSATTLTTNGLPEPEKIEIQQPELPPAEPEVVEIQIHESDLETDETETDEDFYDQNPHLLASKLLAEKRNQNLPLSGVAPFNNQTESTPPQSPQPTRKKVKSKKRKKHQHDTEKKTSNKQKHSISTGYYMDKTSHADTYQNPPIQPYNHANLTNLAPQSPHISILQNALDSSTPSLAAYSAESGSETDSKRLSKRRRLPKKFYGDSSDEDNQAAGKWPRNIQAAVSTPTSVPLSPPIYRNPTPVPEYPRVPPIIIVPAPEDPNKSEEEDDEYDVAESESEHELEEDKKSSSGSSSHSEPEKDAEELSDNETPPLVIAPQYVAPAPAMSQKNENLYCYCQCPYDEVSEMIACDGKDCVIEWFHFECVGIMVPPKGKWYCPDCRKNAATKAW